MVNLANAVKNVVSIVTGREQDPADNRLVPVERVVEHVDYMPITLFETGDMGEAYKGVQTEEWWLNPPYGRPRNIDYTTLEQLEQSEWIEIVTIAVVSGVANAEWAFKPKVDDESGKIPAKVQKQIDEATAWLEALPGHSTFEDIISQMVPDLLWYDAGVIVKVFSITAFDATGRLKQFKGKDYPILGLNARDGRSFMIDANPIGGVWKAFWQYSWMNPGGLPTRFDPDEVMYFRLRPRSRGLYGTSKLEHIKNIVNYLGDATLQGSKILENGMFVGGQIDHPDIRDDKELRRKAAEYRAMLKGPQKSGKWLVTGGNVAVKTFQFTQQEVQWLDGQKWYAKLVMAVAGVTPSELGFCHSKDTEFLTKDGWKLYDDIGDSEEVAGWNKDTGEMVFEIPIKRYHQWFKGNILRFKGKMVDCCVTPNHRMYMKWGGKNDEWQVKPAEDIVKMKSPFYFKQSVDWCGTEVQKVTIPEYTTFIGKNQFCDEGVVYDPIEMDMDDFLQLLGWVVSEGNFYNGKKLTIAQNERNHANEIRDLVNRLPFRFGEYCYDGSNITWITTDRQLCNFMVDVKYHIPRWVFDLSQRQLQLLLDTLCDGDGTYWDDRRDHREYYSCEKSIADDVQEIAIRCGYRTSIYKRTMPKEQWRDLWTVSMSRSHQSWVEQSCVYEEEYDDYVNCFAVPSGFLVTRLNGKISVHHNTEDLNRATGIQQMNIHKSRAIRPILKCIARGINRGIVNKKWPDIVFAYDESMDLDDMQKQATVDKTYLDVGKTTINELRKRDGEEPFEDEVFDMPFAQANQQRAQQKEDMEAQQAQQEDAGGSSWADLFGNDGWNSGSSFNNDSGKDEGENAMTEKAVVTVDGKIKDIDEREEEAQDALSKFWEEIMMQLIKDIEDDVVEGAEEYR